ncbi:MAG: N-acetyl sugar amidotransferase [Desulfobacterota bacterium]|nr:N-acetyl sugar amidotransferase [Thermodesulfobacteriota bacterium]
MVRPRLIPCLLLKNGLIVRSQRFSVHQDIGNPLSTVKRFSDWNVDELILLDISSEDYHDLRRDDLQQRYHGTTALDVLKAVSQVCFMPLAFGGRIRSLEDIRLRLSAGADKCVINTVAVKDPSFITQAAQRFGAQCIVVSIDVKLHEDGSYEVYTHRGTFPTGWDPVSWAQEVERLGAGEIFLNSIDRDGSAQGYDIALIRSVTSAVSIPVIACGGVGRYEHFPPGILEGGASAVSAANIFHFFELSYPLAKKVCREAGIPMRESSLSSRWLLREPSYTEEERERARERASGIICLPNVLRKSIHAVRWCTRCVYPAISAAPMEFDENGVCMGCRMAEVKASIPASEWRRRCDLLREIFERYRCRDGSRHDCIIPVSGGKDSYFQTHVIKNEFGLNPLLVTYNGNNYTPTGWRNLHRMKEVFGVDHIIYSPSVELLKKLNRLGFIIMGDMNWHAHVGITTLPVRIAVQFKIPLIIWGEHGYLDLCGQFSMDDFPEMSYRDRLEHFARGDEWTYFVGLEGITAQDMIPYQYPSDQELFDLDVRGIYLGNYVHWEANDHGPMVIEKYGFQISPEPFERTYRRMSNLDDMHENGVHDYLKYIKFGYGRCTDHVCKDIRAGRMTREEGIELVRQMDHRKPKDLYRWLEYVGMTEEEFDRIADTFRDPRVWRKVNGQWVKDNIWDEHCGEKVLTA